MTERWAITAHHPLYQVSTHGEVRRLWVSHSRGKCTTRLLSPYVGRHGYLKVQLGGKGPRVYVHTLAAMTFLGSRPLGHHVDHIDFDRTNNHLTNLRYLPGPVNSVRWAARVNSHNVWELIADLAQPEDHQQMTKEEADALYQDLAAQGW